MKVVLIDLSTPKEVLALDKEPFYFLAYLNDETPSKLEKDIEYITYLVTNAKAMYRIVVYSPSDAYADLSSIFAALGENQTLETFDVAVLIDGKNLEALASALRRNKTLKTISFQDASAIRAPAYIADALRENTTIESLRIINCRGVDVRPLAGLNFKCLSLQLCQDLDLDSLAFVLRKSPKLGSLVISCYTPNDCVDFAEAIADNQTLEHLATESITPHLEKALQKNTRIKVDADSPFIDLRRLSIFCSARDGILRRFLSADGDLAIAHRIRSFLDKR